MPFASGQRGVAASGLLGVRASFLWLRDSDMGGGAMRFTVVESDDEGVSPKPGVFRGDVMPGQLVSGKQVIGQQRPVDVCGIQDDFVGCPRVAEAVREDREGGLLGKG